MPLGTEVGLGPDDIALDGDPAPPIKTAQPPPPVSAHLYCGRAAVCIRIPLGAEVGLSIGDVVLDGYPVPTSPKGAQPLNFRSMSIVAKRLDGLRCHLVWS